MPDLMIPLIFIIVMFIIIESLESPLFLLLISLLFMPISLLFALTANSYTTLFTANIEAYKDNITFAAMMGGVMATVPLCSALRLIYLHKGWDEALPEGQQYAKEQPQ